MTRLFIKIFVSFWCVGIVPVRRFLHTFRERRRKVKEEKEAMQALTGKEPGKPWWRPNEPWWHDESFGSWS